MLLHYKISDKSMTNNSETNYMRMAITEKSLPQWNWNASSAYILNTVFGNLLVPFSVLANYVYIKVS